MSAIKHNYGEVSKIEQRNHAGFIDIKKAFENVDWNTLFKMLREAKGELSCTFTGIINLLIARMNRRQRIQKVIDRDAACRRCCSICVQNMQRRNSKNQREWDKHKLRVL